LWDFTDRKQYHNRENPQNNCCAGGYPPGNPSGKEHAEWDFALYMDILSIKTADTTTTSYLAA